MDPSHDQAFNEPARVSNKRKRKRKIPTSAMPSTTRQIMETLTRRLSSSSISDAHDGKRLYA
ncbi:hypothetical protein FRB91_001199 [Serendipita sp. 411]|nr:hypothetical protein FRB91_001199 [Serendipita sp. 411]